MSENQDLEPSASDLEVDPSEGSVNKVDPSEGDASFVDPSEGSLNKVDPSEGDASPQGRGVNPVQHSE